MMKRILWLVFLIVGTLSANAQFEKGKKTVGASISGLGMSYSASEKFRFSMDATAGYFVADCLQLRANVGYEHTRVTDDVRAGLGARYYFDQCGVFLGTGAEFVHYTKNSNDVQVPLEVGYAFFINRFITIEPSVYYKMSLEDFSDKSTVGFQLGLGFYF